MDKYLEHEQGRYAPLRTTVPPLPPDNWPYHGKPASPDSRQFGYNAPRFERHIFILRDQLFFDIESQLSVLSDARPKGDGTQDESIANATEKYKQLFFRWIAAHIGDAKVVMSRFLLEPFNNTAMNAPDNAEEVDITLLVPEWYDDTTFSQLAQAVHTFVVNASMLDFLTLRFTANDPVTADRKVMVEDNRNELRKLVNMSKPGRISKPFKPF